MTELRSIELTHTNKAYVTFETDDDRPVFIGAVLDLHGLHRHLVGIVLDYSVDRQFHEWPLADTPTGRVVVRARLELTTNEAAGDRLEEALG